MNNLRNKDFCIAFGKHLKDLREERGYSVRQLALEIGIEHSQISKIENGLINTTISTVYAIAEALEVPIKNLFDFKIPKK